MRIVCQNEVESVEFDQLVKVIIDEGKDGVDEIKGFCPNYTVIVLGRYDHNDVFVRFHEIHQKYDRGDNVCWMPEI